MTLLPTRINFRSLDQFSEVTDAWQALVVVTRFGLNSEVKSSFMVYRKFLWKHIVCTTADMRYVRFGWFEWDRPQKKRRRNDILAIALLIAGTIFLTFALTQLVNL